MDLLLFNSTQEANQVHVQTTGVVLNESTQDNSVSNIELLNLIVKLTVLVYTDSSLICVMSEVLLHVLV